MKKKLTIRDINSFKKIQKNRFLHMLTCYDFQTAQLLNETDLDLILVGDSVGNVILGFETTVEVTLSQMALFGRAVCLGAPQKFVIVDMPFGSYLTPTIGAQNAVKLFRQTRAQALKIEGGTAANCELIELLSHQGIPIMGHIGLQPQSVHSQGGYFTHGKDQRRANHLVSEALALQQAGAFAIVLECVEQNLAKEITNKLSIPTIGIGSGQNVDGQVLVLNDLLHLGPHDPPKFCQPIANLYEQKKVLINQYLSFQEANK